jgi:putative aldouronate transport system substrate-binding protein
MKKTKIFSLIITATLVTSLMAGCGQAKSDSSSSDNDKSPITITFYNKGSDQKSGAFSDPIAKEITKETGVTLKISYPVANQDRIPLDIVNNQYPDIMFVDAPDVPKLVAAGAVIPLQDYIKDSPNLKKMYSQYLNRMRYSSTDSNIYGLCCFGVTYPSTPSWGDSGNFQIQNAVLKELGYPKIKTLDDYENAIKEYVAKHPTINGQKTIGLSLNTDPNGWMCSLGDPGTEALGDPGNGEWEVDSKTCKAEYKFLDPKYKTWFKWLNKMNAEGLLDPDFATQTHDQFIAKMSSGRMLAVADPYWDTRTAQSSLLASTNMQDRTFLPIPMTVDSNVTDQTALYMGYAGDPGIMISKSCKDPKRVMQFLNWMASDKAQVLCNWGIEGKDYKIIDGKRVVPADWKAKQNADSNFKYESGIGLYGYPFPTWGDGIKDPSGQYYTQNDEQGTISAYSAATIQTLKAYGDKIIRDQFTPTSELPAPPSCGAAWEITIPKDSPVRIPYDDAEAVCPKDLPRIITASPADFDAQWDKFQSDLKATGIDKVGPDFTKLCIARAKLWGTYKK